MKRGLWLPVVGFPTNCSSSCSGHRCSVLVWRMRATRHSWRNIRSTELLFISVKMIQQVAEMGMRGFLILVFQSFEFTDRISIWETREQSGNTVFMRFLNLLVSFYDGLLEILSHRVYSSLETYEVSIQHKYSYYYCCLKIISKLMDVNWLPFYFAHQLSARNSRYSWLRSPHLGPLMWSWSEVGWGCCNL